MLMYVPALVYFPPIGRRKLACTADNKPRGRNELIAEKIQRWTGESRTRKQVSSHIQVLKPMVKDDKESECQLLYEVVEQLIIDSHEASCRK
jgi:hypothetical protein